MAKKITIKRRVAGEWKEVYPETIVSQIQGISNTAEEFLNTEFGNVGESLIKLNADGSFTTVAKASVADLIDAAKKGHTHKLSDLQIADLQTFMNKYADLEDGVVPGSQLPSWVVGGLKIKGTISSNTKLDNIFRQNNFEIPNTDESETEFYNGLYFIIEPSGGAPDITLTVSGDNILYGEEEAGVIQDGSTIKLEAGDWLVFRELKGGKYYFDVVNNTYQRAQANIYGTVRLSQATNRSNLQSEDNKVITEGVLKNVLRKIHYADNDNPGDVQDGDILFHVLGDAN